MIKNKSNDFLTVLNYYIYTQQGGFKLVYIILLMYKFLYLKAIA